MRRYGAVTDQRKSAFAWQQGQTEAACASCRKEPPHTPKIVLDFADLPKSSSHVEKKFEVRG